MGSRAEGFREWPLRVYKRIGSYDKPDSLNAFMDAPGPLPGFTANSSFQPFPKKRVLIVGANSYIGDSFAKYAGDRLHISIVDSYEEWKTAPFKEYDSILLVAGLAHQNWNRKKQKANKELYFAVNRDLAIAVAKKAKACGVGQFIFLSSMAVYGLKSGEITVDTKPAPRKNDYYGLSKYQGENGLAMLWCKGSPTPQAPDVSRHSGLDPESPEPLDKDWGIPGQARNDGADVCCALNKAAPLCIIRPPMVYGPNCPGNYSKLVGLTNRMPIFPKVNNRRSMIYIDNLCAFILYAVENDCTGAYLPQNKEHVNTTKLVQTIAAMQGKKMPITKLLNPLISLSGKIFSPVGKLFGSLVYEHCNLEDEYNLIGFEESIRLTINANQL